MFKVIDRYILWEWLKVFGIAVIVMLGILLMNDMYSTLGNLFESGINAVDILKYYLFLSVTLVPIFLPISLLLSFMFVLGAMHRNNEITAMRAAAMNDLRITRSLWIASFVIAGIFMVLNAAVIPVCKENSRKIYDIAIIEKEKTMATRVSEAGVVRLLYFYNRNENRLWSIDKFNFRTNRATGVEVSIFDSNSKEVERLIAEEAIYDDVAKNWTFYDIRKWRRDRNKDGQVVNFRPEKITERKVTFEKFNESPELMKLFMGRPSDMSFYENNKILQALDENSKDALPYLVRKYSIWVSPMICLVVLAIAIPFAMTGVRTNPMVGVSKTMAMFFGYFLLENIMTGLGGSGSIKPLWAAAVPPLCILVFTLLLYRKIFSDFISSTFKKK